LPGHVAQTAATRAFNAVLQYAFGKRGRPRFKRRDMCDSIEGKEVKSTIIWRDGCVRSAGMVIAAILDPANAWQSETLKSPTKYCRVIRRHIRGRYRWYVQLVQQGASPQRGETKPGVVGLLRAVRTDLNLREGGALPFPASVLASERVARITVLNALARPGML
jgi:putative transposase